MNLTLVIVEQRLESLPQTAGAHFLQNIALELLESVMASCDQPSQKAWD